MNDHHDYTDVNSHIKHNQDPTDCLNRPPHFLCWVPICVKRCPIFCEQNDFCKWQGKIGCHGSFGLKQYHVRRRPIFICGFVFNLISLILTIVASMAFSRNYNLLTHTSFTRGYATIPEINNRTNIVINIGFRAIATYDPISIDENGGEEVITFTNFCQLNSMNDVTEDILQDSVCGTCRESSQSFVLSCLINLIIILRNMFSDITRMYPRYDLNCPKCTGSLMSTFSFFLGVYTILLYQQRCFQNFEKEINPQQFFNTTSSSSSSSPDEMNNEFIDDNNNNTNDPVAIQFEWSPGPGLTCLVVATFFRMGDAICNFIVPTPSITRDKAEQEQYEAEFGDPDGLERLYDGDDNNDDVNSSNDNNNNNLYHDNIDDENNDDAQDNDNAHHRHHHHHRPRSFPVGYDEEEGATQVHRNLRRSRSGGEESTSRRPPRNFAIPTMVEQKAPSQRSLVSMLDSDRSKRALWDDIGDESLTDDGSALNRRDAKFIWSGDYRHKEEPLSKGEKRLLHSILHHNNSLDSGRGSNHSSSSATSPTTNNNKRGNVLSKLSQTALSNLAQSLTIRISPRDGGPPTRVVERDPTPTRSNRKKLINNNNNSSLNSRPVHDSRDHHNYHHRRTTLQERGRDKRKSEHGNNHHQQQLPREIVDHDLPTPTLTPQAASSTTPKRKSSITRDNHQQATTRDRSRSSSRTPKNRTKSIPPPPSPSLSTTLNTTTTTTPSRSGMKSQVRSSPPSLSTKKPPSRQSSALSSRSSMMDDEEDDTTTTDRFITDDVEILVKERPTPGRRQQRYNNNNNDDSNNNNNNSNNNNYTVHLPNPVASSTPTRDGILRPKTPSKQRRYRPNKDKTPLELAKDMLEI